METLMIPRLPLALVLYGLALLLSLLDMTLRPAKPWPVLLSTALVVAASTYSLLLGAQLWEVVSVLMVFLLLDLKARA